MGTSSAGSKSTAPLFLRGGVVLGLTLVTLLVCWWTPAPEAGDEAGVEMYLPLRVDAFQGVTVQPSQAELFILPPDTTYAKKAYETTEPGRTDRIFCMIVLSGREKRSIHRPERCLPGQGWDIQSTSTVTIPLASGHQLGTTALLLRRPEARSDGTRVDRQSYFVYWFVAKDVTTPYYLEHILLTNWDLLFHRINQRWAYISIQSDITQGIDPNGRSPEQTLEMLKQFIHDSVPYYVKSEMNGG